jgi:putative endopeptidase
VLVGVAALRIELDESTIPHQPITVSMGKFNNFRYAISASSASISSSIRQYSHLIRPSAKESTAIFSRSRLHRKCFGSISFLRERQREFPIDTHDMDLSPPLARASTALLMEDGWIEIRSLTINPVGEFGTNWVKRYTVLKQSLHDLKTICEEEMQKQEGSSLIGEMYLSGMDQSTIDDAKVSPIQDLLTAINDLSDLKSICGFASSLIKEGVPVFVFEAQVCPDLMDSTVNTLFINQSGLSLPSKDYYFEDSMQEYVAKLHTYVQRLFCLLGDDEREAEMKAKQVIEFETKVAGIFLSPSQMRDIGSLYNPLSDEEFEKLSPNLHTNQLFKTIGLQKPTFFVHSLEYFRLVSELLASTPLNTLRNYLTYRVLFSFSPYLSASFQKEHFEFALKGLSGQLIESPQWELRIEQISPLLQDELGKAYVAKYFPQESKAACVEMVHFILDEFGCRIKQLPWMSDATKEKALLKLSTFGTKIGYPEKWRSYESLAGLISRKNVYCTNIRHAKAFQFEMEMKKYGQPVDPTEWYMAPFMVNAYYNPLGNEIAFPAAVMQPPLFYGASQDAAKGFPALNFGAIGAVISHEITHAFDDQGSLFDHEGNMKNWWTEEDKVEYQKRIGKIVEQFDQYSVHGHPVNGELCQGENIADLGGVSIAFSAFKKVMVAHPDMLMEHPQFTQEQQFFISYARMWRGLMQKDYAISLLKMDPHAPLEFRTDGPLSNLKEFHQAFDVRSGDRMFHPAHSRVQIW